MALNEEQTTASLLFEDPAPRSLPLPPAAGGRKRRLQRLFLLVPDFEDGSGNESAAAEAEEKDVPVSSLTPVLPFEGADTDDTDDAESLKGRGDDLLRSRDYSSAATYYEASLSLTSVLSIGASVVLKRGGRSVVAELDCIEKDTLDVTYLSSDGQEEEGTVREKDILLCLSSGDDDDGPRLQERILLNLSRCLLRLAEIDVAGKRALARPAEYRRAAVLGCTLALTCASHRAREIGNEGGGGGAGTTEEKARLLRAAAFAELQGKYKHAVADLRRALKLNPGCAQAKRMARELEVRDARRKRTDKKLAKEVSRWVQRATDVSEGQGALAGAETNS